MSRKNDKLARAAHIKARTVGTSNEISFSVLDAAKQAMDEGRPSPSYSNWLAARPGATEEAEDVSRETSSAGKIHFDHEEDELFAYKPRYDENHPGPSREKSDAIRNPFNKESDAACGGRARIEQEIARRKKRRKRARVATVSALVLGIVAITFAGAWLWYSDTTDQNRYEELLANAVDRVTTADTVVMALDDVVANPFSDEASAKRDTVDSGLSEARSNLASADGFAREASSGLRDPSKKNAAGETVSTVGARQEMLTLGVQLAEAADETNGKIDLFHQAWAKVTAGDDATREASKLVESDDPTSSKTKTEDALALFREGKSGLEQLQQDCPDVNLSPFISYIETRIEAAGYAIACDDALIARDKETAEEQNEAYNNAEAQAASMAQALPTYPEQLFHEMYSTRNAERISAYETQRSQAGTCDAAIREFLGAESK